MKLKIVLALLLVMIAIGACVPKESTTTDTTQGQSEVNQQEQDINNEISDLDTIDTTVDDSELDDLGLDVFE